MYRSDLAPLSREGDAHHLALMLAAIAGYLAFHGRYVKNTMFGSELRRILSVVFYAIGLEAALGLLSGDLEERAPIAAGIAAFALLATALNRLTKHILCITGAWGLPTVLVGNGHCADEAEATLGSDPLLGYRFVGRIDPETALSEPGTSRLRTLMERHGARHLLIAVDADGDIQRRIIECALRERVPFAMIPPSVGLPAFSFEAARLFGQNPLVLSYRDGLSYPFSRAIKRTIDIVMAVMMLSVASPLFVILAIASRMDGGPVLFAHRRVGAGGRPFYCLKFRTMVVNADRVLADFIAKDPDLAAEWEACRKLVNDPRVTRVGRILRKTSLDELPQLINVLRGEMSLVGPRPIVESEVPLYGEAIAHYYATRPGLTGLWQVSGRSNTSYTRRVQLDVWYVNNWTIWNDIAVILKTIPVVLRRQGAH
jgi:Undecaprenyl-phosphate galactose phosphotransferase WbaP